MNTSPTATVSDYVGVFLVAMATLMLEVLLTRIFSVTLWYHLAFVAVSIAMFGMTSGAVLVYLFSRWFTPSRARLNLTLSTVLFGIGAVWAVDAHLRFAVNPALITSPLTQLSVAYGVISVPFIFSGVAISIALTQFPLQTSRLYAVDLAGAALGCVLLILVLDLVGGPRAVEVVAVAGALASFAFLYGTVERKSLGTIARVRRSHPRGVRPDVPVHARPVGARTRDTRKAPGGPDRTTKNGIRTRGSPVQYPKQEVPFGWGLSDTYQPTDVLNQLRLNIDGSAETVLTRFGGNLDTLQHLKYDITNIAHYLTDAGRVFVIGAGGGRDVLSALVFNQKRSCRRRDESRHHRGGQRRLRRDHRAPRPP